MWERIAIALLPVPAFYLIYYRYFTFRPEYVKHIEAFLSGIAFALILLLSGQYIFDSIGITNPFFLGFVQAAAAEKIGAFFIILLLHLYYPNFSMMESILSAMIFGIGFSAVENVFYAVNFGFSIIAIRILFSVPLHLTTCGIMGYYLGKRTMSTTRVNRVYYSVMALTVSILLHGIFDTAMLMGGSLSYLASPMLIGMVIALEIFMAHAQTMLPRDVIAAMDLRHEEWEMIVRQPVYERWILQSMGTPDRDPELFFQWRPGLIRFSFVIIFMVAALMGLAFRVEITDLLNAGLGTQDQVIILGAFPFSISVILILVGAINPNFFRNSKIKIPVITDVEVTTAGEFEEVLVTYDITTANCFLRTAEPLGAGTKKTVRFELQNFSSPVMEGVIVWENHVNPHAPRGSVIRLIDPSPRFYFAFMARYVVFRVFKGVVFTLKLPGFESIRKLFMRPVTTMQEIRVIPAGSTIYREGDRAAEFFLLKKGRVIFYKTKENGEIITIDTIEEEQVFGEMAVIGTNTRTDTARCVTDCVIAVAGRENLNALVRNNTEFSLNLLESLAKRVQISEKVLLENISGLENEKMRDALITHAGLLMMLAGTGHRPEANTMEVPVDLGSILKSLGTDDPETVIEILTKFVNKQAFLHDENRVMTEKMQSLLDTAWNDYRVRLKIRKL